MKPNGGFEIKLSSRRFLLKNENLEGVLMSPFFKDMAVVGRYRCVLIYFPNI
jgi:hypothetical protein